MVIDRAMLSLSAKSTALPCRRGGEQLKRLRNSLGLALRDVQEASSKIARELNDTRFAVPFSRLAFMEKTGMAPNIYRLYSLAVIYHKNISEFFQWFGINLAGPVGDFGLGCIPFSHKIEPVCSADPVQVPMQLATSFSSEMTSNILTLVEKWGALPFRYLEELATKKFSYAYVGSKDLSMYPLIMPGSFLQVDECRTKVVNSKWKSEYERPIYFIETRNDGFRVGWCSVIGRTLTIHPHPLSPMPVKSYINPKDAEVIGQVVGIGMKLVER